MVATLQPLVGLRLQEILTGEQDIVLGFYSPHGLLWLWMDLNAARPCVLPWSTLPQRPQLQKSPLNLFLRAHFDDHVLRAVARAGRVVNFTFGNGERVLELRLTPHTRNFIAKADGKQVAWQKPSPILGAEEKEMELPIRGLERLREEWLALRGQGKTRAQKKSDPRERLQKDLEKKQKALLKVQEELQRKQDLPWKDVGDWLKAHQTLDVPQEFEPFVDRRRKLSWNIEQCFTKARETEGKAFGTEKRLAILKEEIAALEQRLSGPLRDVPKAHEKPKISLGEIEAHGRTLRLSDEITVIAGKSAADNLKILRKARSWDLWVHLRDYPSSHAVVFRNKNTKIGDAVLNQVAEWFVRQQLGDKIQRHRGEKFALLVAECRHVRPIKGDKIGRVTYRDERVLIYKLPS